jgi:hypothetical protein
MAEVEEVGGGDLKADEAEEAEVRAGDLALCTEPLLALLGVTALWDCLGKLGMKRLP